MSDLLEAIRARLVADATISGIVGTRIRPEERPQSDELPAITYTLADMERPHYVNGQYVGQSDATIQFDCWATTRAVCVTLKAAIEQSFDGFRGTQSGVVIRWCGQVNELDLDEPPEPGSDTATFHTVIDYRFRYEDV
jgi:hypothetical protein